MTVERFVIKAMRSPTDVVAAHFNQLRAGEATHTGTFPSCSMNRIFIRSTVVLTLALYIMMKALALVNAG